MAVSRSRVMWMVLALVVVVALVTTVITVVAVTLSNSNRRDRNTGESSPSTTTKAPPEPHNVTLGSITVLLRDRIQIKLDFTFQYYIGQEHLQELVDKYGAEYEYILEVNAVDEVQSASGPFAIRDFIYELDVIERALLGAVRRRLGNSCCEPSCQDLLEGCKPGCKQPQDCTDQDRGFYADVRFFHLDFVDIPDDILTRILTTAPPT